MKKLITTAESHVILFLNQVIGQLDANSQEALRAGKLQLEEHTLYTRNNIEASSNIEDLLLSSTDASQGVTNIDGKKLPDQENFVVQGLTIKTGSGDGVTNPILITNFSNVRGTANNVVGKGKFQIIQSQAVLFEIEIDELLKDASQTTGVSGAAYELENKRLIKAGQPFDFRIIYADGQSVDAGGTVNTHIEVKAHGYRTKVRG